MDKRSREQRDPLPLRGDHARQTIANASTLSQLQSRFGGRAVKLRVPTQAHPVDIAAAAAQAARLRDLMAHVTTARGQDRAVPLWDETRIWDPGD